MTATGITTNGSVRTVATKPKDFECFEQRLLHVWDKISTDLLCADFVAIEGLAFSSKTGQAAERAGLHHFVRVELYRHAVPWALIPPTSLKRWVCGKGNASKDEMVIASVRLFPDIMFKDNNGSDSLGLYSMAKDHFGEPIVEVPRANRTALDKIEWPKGL